MGYIDAHAHVWTDDLSAYPLPAGFTRRQMSPASFTPGALLGHARPCGVDRIILVQMSYYGVDNAYMLDAMAAHPGVFGGIAVISRDAEDVEDHMNRLLALGVRGLRVRPTDRPAGAWLDRPGYDRMFARAARNGQAICCLIDPDGLPDLERMCRRYPDTPVVIDHLCRIGAGGPIVSEQVATLCEMARYPAVAVKVSAFYALGSGQAPYHDLLPMIRQVLGAYGPQRLMWATDCPFQVEHGAYEASLALVRDDLGLSDTERDWLLRGTAERVFL